MTECCESIVEICFTIFSGSGFFTVLLYAPSMAKLRDEEFNFCNKIVILNVTVHSWLWLCVSKRVRWKKHEGKVMQSDIPILPEKRCQISERSKGSEGHNDDTVCVCVWESALTLFKLTAEDNPLATSLLLLWDAVPALKTSEAIGGEKCFVISTFSMAQFKCSPN